MNKLVEIYINKQKNLQLYRLIDRYIEKQVEIQIERQKFRQKDRNLDRQLKVLHVVNYDNENIIKTLNPQFLQLYNLFAPLRERQRKEALEKREKERAKTGNKITF